jgi:hypothetical protein
MNQPVYQPPQQYAPQPQQQYAPPQQFAPPQQQYAPPQQQFAPPNMGMPSQAVAAAAAGGLFNQFLSEPPRKRANRAKPADGTYVVQFNANCKVDYSQKDARPYLILEYRVVEGTVPQMQGQTFSVPLFWSNRMQLQDLADMAKYVFGMQLPNVAAQTQGNPQIMAQFIGQTVAQGCYAGVRIQRSQKQVQQVGYEQAFANHNWICVTGPQQPLSLAALNVQAAPQPPSMPPMQAPQMMQPQQPPGQTMMPQPQQPQQFQAPQPGMYQPQPQAPQQPFPSPPVAATPSSLPQAPALPQASAQPAPAYYVPGALPQR